MISMKSSYLILDFNRPEEGKILLESLKIFAQHEKEVIYLVNGGESDYAYNFYKEGLIDTLIIKKYGDGGGFGQTDLFRYCKTKFAFFVQVDQKLIRPITEYDINSFIESLNFGYKCIDLNGDQSRRDVWTDRVHFINVEFFNSLGPFPNFGPGLDNGLWNEKYLQDKFIENGYLISHQYPLYFQDMGVWSVRQAGDAIYKHRTDLKSLFVIKKPTFKTEVYPPLNSLEWEIMLKGEWIDGTIPEKWREYSFRCWD